MAKRRLKSTHAVGASLSPVSMQNYIRDWYDEQNKRLSAQSDYQDVVLGDPLARQQIAQKYIHDRMGRTQNLAARGLSAAGYSAHDIHDIERARVMAEDAQAMKLRTAQANFNATITLLNNQRTATDKAYAAEAGQNIQAGTGRYKNEKPAGWRPPALQGAATGTASYTASNPQPAAPASKAPATSPTRLPTGARLSTGSSAPSVLGLIHARPRGLTAGRTRRVRLA